MEWLFKFFILIPGLIHIYFMYLEMFLWEKPRTLRAFGLTPTLAQQTKSMAFNQGLYNGFLAVGLIWSLFISEPQWSSQVQVFFLSCIFLAGVIGALTVAKKIFFVQSLPAVVPLVWILVGNLI